MTDLNKIIEIPDPNFKRYLVENFDKDGDGEISIAEALEVKEIGCWCEYIASLEGLEYFANLECLECQDNIIMFLDLSGNPKLKRLNCSMNLISQLDVSMCPNLEILLCFQNYLTTIDVCANSDLSYLQCSYNSLKNLNLDNNTNLRYLRCDGCSLENLSVSYNRNLLYLGCSDNDFSELNLESSPFLKLVDIDMCLNLSLIKLNKNIRNSDLLKFDAIGNMEHIEIPVG